MSEYKLALSFIKSSAVKTNIIKHKVGKLWN